MHEAWVHARRRGTPLNTFVTIRPQYVDELTPLERWELWSETYNQLTQYARYRKFEFVMVWVRESSRPAGEGEHLHALIWVPQEHRKHFEKRVSGWFEAAPAVKIVTAHQHTSVTSRGKFRSAIGYLTKAAPPQRTYGNPSVFYRASGPILGRRSGMTRNLSPKAIAVWRAQGSIQNEFRTAA